MSILHKYWLKEFFRLYLMIQMIILVIFVFIDYLSQMERFLNSEITLTGAMGYILLKVPFMFVQLSPAGIMLAAVSVFSIMNRNNELTALKSSGISVYYLIKPALIAGMLLTALSFFLSETVIPATMSRSNQIKYSVILKSRVVSYKKDLWIKSDHRFVHMNYFNPAQKTISGITITEMNQDFKIVSRIDAMTGTYDNGYWHLQTVVEQALQPDENDYQVTSHTHKKVQLDIKPEELEAVVKKSEEMSFSELKKLVFKIENEGYDATKYRVDLHAKAAFPFICLIMALTGAATGMRSKAKDNLPVGITIGVVISFLYWVIFGFCLSLGYGKILPPAAAAWITNIIFLCSGIIYLIHVE